MLKRILGMGSVALLTAALVFVIVRQSPGSSAVTGPEAADEAEFGTGQPRDPTLDGMPPPVAETAGAGPTLVPPADAGPVRDVQRASGADGKPVDVAGKPFGFALLNGQEPTPIGGSEIINGKPTLMAQLEIAEPAQEVVNQYIAQLAANHIRAMEGTPLGAKGPHYLSYRPWSGGPLKTITVVPQGNSSLVLASISDVAMSPDFTPPAMPEGMPERPDAKNIHVTENREGSSRQRNISFILPKSTLPDVRTFYTGALSKLGFVAEPSTWDHQAASDWRQSFSRGPEKLAVAVVPHGSDAAVTLIWVQG